MSTLCCSALYWFLEGVFIDSLMSFCYYDDSSNPFPFEIGINKSFFDSIAVNPSFIQSGEKPESDWNVTLRVVKTKHAGLWFACENVCFFMYARVYAGIRACVCARESARLRCVQQNARTRTCRFPHPSAQPIKQAHFRPIPISLPISPSKQQRRVVSQARAHVLFCFPPSLFLIATMEVN